MKIQTEMKNTVTARKSRTEDLVKRVSDLEDKVVAINKKELRKKKKSPQEPEKKKK